MPVVERPVHLNEIVAQNLADGLVHLPSCALAEQRTTDLITGLPTWSAAAVL